MGEINLKGETEESLVAALRQRKQKALRLLYDAYAPVYLGVISRIVQNQDVAEQVLQETFLAIWSRINVYDSSQNRFFTWSLAIARGLALETVRSGRSLSFANTSEKCTFVETKAGEHPALVKEHGVQKVSQQLEETERAVLDLIYLQGRTCSEAAGELGLTEETLKNCLKKAFTHLGAGKTA